MPLTDNLLAYYKLDEASGNALDAHSVGPYPLTDNGGVGAGAGKLNGARVFDGATTFFSRATNILNGLTSFSISFWIKSTQASLAFHSDFLFATYDNGIGDGVTLFLDGNNPPKIQFHKVKGYGASNAMSDVGIVINQWYHIACVCATDGTMTLYVNGVAQATTGNKVGAVTNTSAFNIGTSYSGSDFWKGPIDEFGIWSRALTSAEVTSLYNSGTPPAYPFSGGGDTTPPTLSAPTAVATGTTTATIGVTTDEGNGTLYFVVTNSATPPTIPQIIAGQDSTGTGGFPYGTSAVSSPGAMTIDLHFLSPATTYYVYFFQRDAAGNDSAVIATPAFTTDTPAALTPGVPSFVSAGPAFVKVTTTDAVGGIGPYACRWQRSLDNVTFGDMADGGGVTGSGTRDLTDGSAVLGTRYWYRPKFTDAASTTVIGGSVGAQPYDGGPIGSGSPAFAIG